MKKEYSKSAMLHLTKGFHRGHCNRQSCLSPEDVVWFNHSTRKFYCKECAIELNEMNKKEAIEFYGHDICLQMDVCGTCKGSGESQHGGPCCMCDGMGYQYTEDK